MSRTVKKRGVLFGAPLTIGSTLAVVIGFGAFAGGGAAASSVAPVNASPPTISGTPQEGQKLTGDRGTWSNAPTSYSYTWTRCDKTGGSCSTISGATATAYTLVSADVTHALRFSVDAKNADGSTSATSVPTAVIVAATAAPVNTLKPSITGTAQAGQTLAADEGNWNGGPTLTFSWLRCDKNGGSCAKIGGATTKSYLLTSADVGNTLRFRVDAKNADGSTTATSVPTAVVVAATKPPPATGCPTGSGTVQVADVGSPARLLIDQQQTNPSTVTRTTTDLIVRYHVSACGGRSVQGALLYATAVPFNQLAIPAEQATGSDGWVQLDFRMMAGFPVSSHQQLIAIFARARKTGEDPLGGISTRRLFSIPVHLNG